MENQVSPFLKLKPLQPPDEQKLRTLLEALNEPLKCDRKIFTKIHNLFFLTNSADFDKLAQYSTNHVIITLLVFLKSPKISLLSADKRILKFKSEFFSLLTFIGFRYLNVKTSEDQLELLCKQIENCNLQDLSSLLRIIRFSFEANDLEFLKVCSPMISAIIIPTTKRLYELILPYNEITPAKIVPLLTLITIISFWAKKFPHIQPCLQSAQKVLDENVAIKNISCPSLPNLISLYTLQSKSIWVLSSDSTRINAIPCLVYNIMTLPTSVPTLIDDSSAILIQFLRGNSEERIDNFVEYLPLFFDFRRMTGETFHLMHAVVASAFEIIIKKTVNRELLLKFVKFACSTLHFRKANFNQCSTHFHTLLPMIQLPQSIGILRTQIISLLFYSFDIGLIEIQQQLFRIDNSSKDPFDMYPIFNSLLYLGESFYRIVKFFVMCSRFVISSEINAGKKFAMAVSSVLPLIEFQNYLNGARRILIILMKFRDVLQKIVEISMHPKPSSDIIEYYSLCTQQLKAVRAYEKTRHYHLHSAQDFVTCLSNVPPAFHLQLWDQFFEDFFKIDEKMMFDSCTFRMIVAEPRVFPNFFSSLMTFSIQRLRSGHGLTHLIKSLHVLLEKLTLKTSDQAKTMDNAERLHQDSQKFINACKELTISPQFCQDALGLIQVFCQFIDYISLNSNITSRLLQEPYVGSVSKNLLTLNIVSHSVISFILFCSTKNQDILKSEAVIKLLINHIIEDPDRVIDLLHSAKKQDKKSFYKNTSILKMYKSLCLILNKSNQKDKIIKFLKHAPLKELTNVDIIDRKLLKNITFKFQRGDTFLVLKESNLVSNLAKAIDLDPSNEYNWDISFSIISSLVQNNNWTIENRRKIGSIISTWLYHPKQFKRIFNQVLRFNSIVLNAYVLVLICSISNEPPKELLNPILISITNRSIFIQYVKEIFLILESKLMPNIIIMQTISFLFMNYLKRKIIDPIYFAFLVHRTIIEIYSPDWINEQRNDKRTKFLELNFLSEPLQKLTVFCRYLLKNEKIKPLLHLIKTSTSLLPILIVADMISEIPSMEEVIEFIDECISDMSLASVNGLSLILGPLTRVFPDLRERYLVKMADIIYQSLKKLPQMNRREQGLFFVLLVPSMGNNQIQNIDFSSIIEIIRQVLSYQSPLLKCQAQLLIQTLYTNGDAAIRTTIQNLFEMTIKKLTKVDTFLKWAKYADIVFTFFPLFPNRIIEDALYDLEKLNISIYTVGYQSMNVTDFFRTLTSMINFLSTKSVIDVLISSKRYYQAVFGLASAYSLISYIRYQVVDKLIANFFILSEESFIQFFNAVGINNVQILEFFYALINNNEMKNCFLRNQKRILISSSSLIIETKVTQQQIYLAGLAIRFKQISDDFATKIQQIAIALIDLYETDFVMFKSTVFNDIVEYFIHNYQQKFMLIAWSSTCSFTPLLIAPCIQVFSQIIDTYEFTIEDLTSVPFSDDLDKNIWFIGTFLIPYFTKPRYTFLDFINYIYTKFEPIVFIQLLNLLKEAKISTDDVNVDPYELYSKCVNDYDKLQSLIYWTQKDPSNHFKELYSEFFRFFNVHLPNEVRTICDILIIPNDIEEKEVVFEGLLEIMHRFTRYPPILAAIFSLYVNNRQFFEPIEDQVWSVIIEQAIGIHTFTKKELIISLKPTFLYLSKLIPTMDQGGTSDNLHALIQHLAIFISKVLKFCKAEFDILLKLRGGFLKTIIQIAATYGPQLSFIQDLFQITIDLFHKIQSKHQLITNEPVVFDMMIHMLPDLFKSISKAEGIPLLNEIVDVFIGTASTQTYSCWPAAMTSLTYLAESPHYQKYISEKIASLPFSQELITRIFPILWKYTTLSYYRVSVLIPFALKFCRTYSQVELPIEMMICDEILTIMFDFPYDSALFYIFKSMRSCLSSLSDNGCQIFVLRVLTQGLLSSNKDEQIKKEILSFFENKEISSLVFSKNAPSANELILPYLPLNAQLENAKYLPAELREKIISKLDANSIPVLAEVMFRLFEIPISYAIYLSSSLNPVYFKLGPVKRDDVLVAYFKPGISSLSGDELSTWSPIKTEPINFYIELGLIHQACDIATTSQIEVPPSIVDFLIEKTDRELKPIVHSLNMEIKSSSEFENVIKPKIDTMLNYFTLQTLPQCMIIRELKKVSPLIDKKEFNDKLFNFKISPSCNPSIHRAYKEIRSQVFHFIPRPKSYMETEYEHLKLFRKSEEFHFICNPKPIQPVDGDLLVIEEDYKQFIMICVNLDQPYLKSSIIQEALNFNPKSDIFLSVALNFAQEIKFSSIPFNFSHSFADLKLSNLLPSIHPGFHIIGLEIPNCPIDICISYLNFISQLLIILYSEGDSLYLGSISYLSLNPPLYDCDPSVLVQHVVVYKDSLECDYINVLMRLTNGEKVSYIVTKWKPMETNFAVFSDLITKIFKKSSSSYSRSQFLPSYHSIQISDKFYLTRTSARPIHCLNVDGYSSKKEYSDYAWHLGTQYSALSLMIHAAGYIPELEEILFNQKTASFSIPTIKQNNQEVKLILNASIKKLIDAPVLNRSYKFGLVSAANTLSFHKSKFKFLLKTMMKESFNEPVKMIQNVNKFSIIKNSPSDVEDEINRLIEKALSALPDIDNFIW